jgi:hypothetical protein
MSIVSLVLAPTLASMFREKNSNGEAAKQNVERSDTKKTATEAAKTATFR